MNYSLFNKYPLKIINGTKTGPAKASATFVDGAIAERSVPS